MSSLEFGWSSESRWQLGQCQITPLSAWAFIPGPPCPRPAPPSLHPPPCTPGWQPGAHYSLKQKPFGPGHLPPSQRSGINTPPFSLSPNKTPCFLIPRLWEEPGRDFTLGGLSPFRDPAPLLQRLKRNQCPLEKAMRNLSPAGLRRGPGRGAAGLTSTHAQLVWPGSALGGGGLKLKPHPPRRREGLTSQDPHSGPSRLHLLPPSPGRRGREGGDRGRI